MREGLVKLRRRLIEERGEGDPILTIVAMTVSAAMAAAMISVIILTITLGANYVAENVTAANLASARKSWSLDANNASFIDVRTNTEVTFVELPHQAPGVYLQRPGKDGDVCRLSTWAIVGDQLTNRVEKYDPADCGTDGAISSTPFEVLPLYTFSGIAPGTTIEAWNTAGRDLYFDADGTEIGLAENSPAPSTAERKSWWRDYEWRSTAVRRVNITSEIKMPLSGDSPIAIVGSSWITTSNQGETFDTPEREPEVTVWNPGAVTGAIVQRSTSVGEIHGLVREGLDADLSSVPVDCGPWSVEWTVTVTPRTPGHELSEQEQTFTSFGAPTVPVSFADIPNGTEWDVTVDANCPTEDTPATPFHTVFEQTLPTPHLDAEVVDDATPHLHRLSWESTSSLSLSYRPSVSVEGIEPQPALSPETTSALGAVAEYPLGSTYGLGYEYRLVAEVDGGLRSGESEPALVFTPWPPVPEPTVDVTPQGPEVIDVDAGGTDAECPAGTHMEWRIRQQVNEGGWQGWTDWATTQHWTYVTEQGQRYEYEVEARCATAPDHHSDPSDPGTDDPWDEPITTTVTPPITHNDPPGEDDPVDYHYATPDPCPAQTTPEYRVRYALNADADAAPPAYGDWSDWTTDPETTISVWFGERILVSVEARCVSQWTDGPPTTTEDPWVRPIPPPPGYSPTIWTDNGGTSPLSPNRALWTEIDECWTNTHPEYRADRQPYGSGAWNGHTPSATAAQDVATQWGYVYIYRASGRCVSDYSGPGGPEKGAETFTASTSWQFVPPQPIVHVTGVSPSSVRGGATVTISSTVISGCPAPTNLVGEAWITGGTHVPWATVRGAPAPYVNATTSRAGNLNVYCDGANVDGPAYAHSAGSVTVIPAAPGVPVFGASMGGSDDQTKVFRLNGNGAEFQLDWGTGSGSVTHYEYRIQHVDSNGNQYSSSSTTTSSTILWGTCYASPANPATTTAMVRAVGPGGTSGWATITRAGFPNGIRQGCA